MNCRQPVRLLSDQTDRDLAGDKRLPLRLHPLICVGCRNYRRQLSFLRQACQLPGPSTSAAVMASVTTPD